MRVRLEFADSLVAPELRCSLFALPPQLETVADLARALGADPAFSLASCAAARAGLRLHVRGFFLPPTQPVAGVLRDDDVVSVSAAGGAAAAPRRARGSPKRSRSTSPAPAAAKARKRQRSASKPAAAEAKAPAAAAAESSSSDDEESSSSSSSSEEESERAAAVTKPAPAEASSSDSDSSSSDDESSDDSSSSSGSDSDEDGDESADEAERARQQQAAATAKAAAGAARAAALMAAAPRASGSVDSYSNPSTTFQNPPAATGSEEKAEPKAIKHHRSAVEEVPVARTPAAPGAVARRSQARGSGDAANDTRVYIGNLAWEVDEQAVRNALGGCGTITNIKWLTDRSTGDFKGSGFVTFATADAAAAALEQNGEAMCLGRSMVVGPALAKPQPQLQHPPGMGHDRRGSGPASADELSQVIPFYSPAAQNAEEEGQGQLAGAAATEGADGAALDASGRVGDTGACRVAVGSLLGYKLLELSASWQPVPGAARTGVVKRIEEGESGLGPGTVLTLSEEGGEVERTWSDLVDPKLLSQSDEKGEEAAGGQQGRKSRRGGARRSAKARAAAADQPSAPGSDPQPAGAAAASPAPAAAAPAASAPRQSYDRVASVVAQLEYYFSEKNLARDEYLRGLLEQKGAWVVRRRIPRA